jgi:hypothetical protein
VGEKSEFVERIAIGAAAIALGIAIGIFWPFGEDDTEDRPPIVVSEGSIHFGHGYGWVDMGSQKTWRPDHEKGKDVKKYIVSVTSKGVDAGCGFTDGKEIVIAFGLQTFTLNTKAHSGGTKDEPALVSTVALVPDTSGLNLTFLDNANDLDSIEVDKKKCVLTGKERVRIKLEPKP